MNTWYNFYKNRINDKYFNHIQSKYEYFINFIDEIITKNDILLEVGCGIGSITKALPNNIIKLISDKEELMLMLAKENTNITGFKFNIIKDNYNMNCDIIHSHGVLEHFNDEQIQEIIKKQKQTKCKLIHYVPSYKYEIPSFGDERLLTKDQWYKICHPTEIVEFNDGYDFILYWK